MVLGHWVGNGHDAIIQHYNCSQDGGMPMLGRWRQQRISSKNEGTTTEWRKQRAISYFY
jgi:hypothetical protein